MELSRQLRRELKLNYNVLMAQADGLTHEDSLLQLPFQGNCLNWVLGHLVEARGRMLAIAAIEPLWDNAEYARYGRGSEPITEDAQALRLEKILGDLTASQDRLLARIKEMTPAELDAVPAGADQDVGAQLSFLSWHETYHTGQTEYLRQLAGKGDQVIP